MCFCTVGTESGEGTLLQLLRRNEETGTDRHLWLQRQGLAFRE